MLYTVLFKIAYSEGEARTVNGLQAVKDAYEAWCEDMDRWGQTVCGGWVCKGAEMGEYPDFVLERWQWVDYFDVWGDEDEDDGFQVNDLCRTNDYVVLSSEDMGSEVLKAMRGQGILSDKATVNTVFVEFMDDTIIEMTEEKTGRPLGRLERVSV